MPEQDDDLDLSQWFWEVQAENSPQPRLVLRDRGQHMQHATYLVYDDEVFNESEPIDLRAKVFWATTACFVGELFCRALGIELPAEMFGTPS